MWFQQDGATCLTTRANMALLQETSPGCVIFRCGDINWPLRLCDLTSLDFFYWATRKTVFMQINLLEHLKANIRHVMAEITPNRCKKKVENYLKRIYACNISLGDHLNDVVFHTHSVNVQTLQWKKKYHEKKYFLCVLFTFTFETTKYITRHMSGWTCSLKSILNHRFSEKLIMKILF